MEHTGLSVPEFLFALVAIWMGAKAFGELAERIGQPAVLGEMLVGVILGPSLLGLVDPHENTLHLLAEVGVCILLFEIGLEINLKDFLKVGVTSLFVALVGVFVPFLTGYFVIDLVEHLGLLKGLDPEKYELIAIFTGAAMTATSVGITARVLADLNKLRSREAQTILGAAVIDDVLGIVILAVVSKLALDVSNGIPLQEAVSVVGILKTLGVAIGFLVVAVAVGQKLVHPLFRLVDLMRSRGFLFLSALSFAMFMAFLADTAGSALIIGSFAAGILLAGTDKFSTIEHQLKPVADVFTPIFFVVVGSNVDIGLFLAGGPALTIGLVLFAIAVIGKLAAGLGAWGTGASKLAIGTGMIPRGEVGLIFAQEGLKTGILSPDLFGAVLFMVFTTTLVSPPLLKLISNRFQDDPATA